MVRLSHVRFGPAPPPPRTSTLPAAVARGTAVAAGPVQRIVSPTNRRIIDILRVRRLYILRAHCHVIEQRDEGIDHRSRSRSVELGRRENLTCAGIHEIDGPAARSRAQIVRVEFIVPARCASMVSVEYVVIMAARLINLR